MEGSGYATRRLADDWNDWGRKQREEDRLLSEEEFDTAFERGYNEYYREDASSPYLQQQLNYVWRGEKNFIPQYAEFDEISSPGDDILDAKKEIEKTLDMINQAFVTLLNNLFRDAAFDASADAQVLQTMLAREGLAESDFVREKSV